MDSQEESHAAARVPGPAFWAPASPASAEPQKRQSVSTKLAHDQDAENLASESSSSPENPNKALRWFHNHVVTPTRTQLNRVKVSPMVNSRLSSASVLSTGFLRSRTWNPSTSSNHRRPKVYQLPFQVLCSPGTILKVWEGAAV